MDKPKTLLVLPRASRFDIANASVLAGPARQLCDEALGTYDVCYANALDAYRKQDYTHIILTGQESLDAFMPNLTLSSARGYVYHLGPQKIVATFWPQDAVDIRNYEDQTDEDEVINAASTGKDGAPTQRNNYRFWFLADCRKVFATPQYVAQAQFNHVGNDVATGVLARARGQAIYLDIESHPDTNTLQCLSFAVGDGPVYTVTIYDYTNRLQHGAIKVLSTLARRLCDSKIVIHNAGFDLCFLALFHGMPFGPDIEDTMLMGHRIFPEAEKSLAHNITLWINEPYHKSEGGTWHPRNATQMEVLLRYNSKDVATLRAVHKAQNAYVEASGDKGLRDSIRQVNESIFPYLYTSLHGLPVNCHRLLELKRAEQVAADQYLRIIQILAGFPLNPASPQQVARYFIEGLHYPCAKCTETGAPCVDEGQLYKLLMKFANPIIPAILKQKHARKVVGELGFRPWFGLKKR